MMNEQNDMISHEEKLKQQLEGNTVEIPNQPNLPEIEPPKTEESKFGMMMGKDFRIVEVNPKIAVALQLENTISPEFDGHITEKPIEKNGEFYSFFSPFRPGNGTEEKPYGVLSKSLDSVVDYLQSFAQRFMVFDQEEFESKTSLIEKGIKRDLSKILYGNWSLSDDNSSPSFRIVEKVEQEDGGFSVNSVHSKSHIIPVTTVFEFDMVTNIFDDDSVVTIEPTLVIRITSKKIYSASDSEGFRRFLKSHITYLKRKVDSEISVYCVADSTGLLENGFLNYFDEPVIMTKDAKVTEDEAKILESIFSVSNGDIVIREK